MDCERSLATSRPDSKKPSMSYSSQNNIIMSPLNTLWSYLVMLVLPMTLVLQCIARLKTIDTEANLLGLKNELDAEASL